jgi:cytochrome P450
VKKADDEIRQMAAQFDHASEGQMRDPHPMYARFRAECPVGRSENYGGFYVASRYADVKRVFEEYATFSSSTGVGIPPHPYKMLPIDLDPPQQTKFRRILNKAFTVEAVAPKRAQIEAEVNTLIDAFIENGEADLARDLVRPLLPAIVLPMLGVPVEDRRQLTEWIEYLTRGRATDMEGVMKTGEMIGGYLMALVARRRNEPRADDVISLMLDAKIDDATPTDEEIFRTLLITLFGGLDTTSAVMLEALLYLSRHPDARRRLMSGEFEWIPAIEEFVRYTSPVQGLRRTVTRSAELAGQPLREGDWMFALIGSANRDETVFPDAQRCVLDRAPNPHIGFSTGAHICLGRYLARLEIEILLKAVLQRLPDYQVVSGFEPDYLVGEARGMKRLPVTFTPAARQLV